MAESLPTCYTRQPSAWTRLSTSCKEALENRLVSAAANYVTFCLSLGGFAFITSDFNSTRLSINGK